MPLAVSTGLVTALAAPLPTLTNDWPAASTKMSDLETWLSSWSAVISRMTRSSSRRPTAVKVPYSDATVNSWKKPGVGTAATTWWCTPLSCAAVSTLEAADGRRRLVGRRLRGEDGGRDQQACSTEAERRAPEKHAGQHDERWDGTYSASWKVLRANVERLTPNAERSP